MGVGVKRTTFRQALTERPDVIWRHHLGQLLDTQGLTNRLCASLGAEAWIDERTGTLYTFWEIARIVEPVREEREA
jgi:hypothetical protein